ncbi:hypothetical protein DSC45_07710 [Streptomyces sp. YIM 130001]|uniref:DUF4350 domain-containing protein n=1 Tax=Streptomyces sp. YIM 130001 TaxID=2259644 RepID=UPI000E659D8C|nr:DUF4350 domain-containing protein [Streptomyces sp. YIM 130001]RII19881.1 hypothetical protein DSC45_07710 [Streptomyces sp. YIM 130001]
MTGAAPVSTSASPTARQVWTRGRGILLALTLLLVAGIAIAAVRSGGQHGRLDPRSADPNGSLAVAELLAERDVSTRVVTTTAQAARAAGPDTTVLVAAPDALTHRQQSKLRSATENAGGRTVLLSAGAPSVARLAPGVEAAPPSIETTLEPGCSLPEARRAGRADTGGARYDTARLEADSCYVSDGLPTLLRMPDDTGKGDTVLIGAADILYNDRLDDEGNASLTLQLLGSRPHLVWYLPSLSDAAAEDDSGESSFVDLVPAGWRWGALQLTIAAVLAALWQGRRLGPLVLEHLPVAVRASETVEGRARLYRKANARERAATALRSATRSRLAPLVGLPPSRAQASEALLPALSSQLPDSTTDLQSLLFGPPPSNDAALVALADQLDALEREVRTS